MAKEQARPLLEFSAVQTDAFPSSSVFSSIDQSSDFFKAGSIGYSSRQDSCKLDGLLLKTCRWDALPLSVQTLASAYFDDQTLFPAGTIESDHGLLMRDVPHEWHSQPEMIATT